MNSYRSSMRFCLPLLLLAVHSARAQLGAIDALASKVTDVGIYSQFRLPWSPSGAAVAGHQWNGFGLELSFTVLDHKHAISSVREAVRDTSPVEEDTAVSPAGTTRSAKSTITTVRAAQADSESDYYVDFSVTYSQTILPARRFAPLAPGVDSVEVRGGYKEFPAANVYITRVNRYRKIEQRQVRHRLLKCFVYALCSDPYIGAFGGVVDLSLKGFAPTAPTTAGQPVLMTSVSGTGSVFEGGLSVGGIWGVNKAMHAYVELDRAWRAVPAVDWTGAGNGLYPVSVPTHLDLTSWQLVIGTQVHIGSGK